jgi:predicted transposase/invertase (TIGR01784 family)
MQQWSWLPHWEHLLIDLGALGPERVRGELKGRIAQLSMIAAYRDARRILRDVLPLLGELYRRGEVDDFGRLVLYIYATQKEEIREQFAQGLHRQVPGSGGEVMNYLEQLVEQGRQAGRQEGREAGRQAGRQEGRQEGRQAGRQEGREAGRQEGELATIERLVRAGVEWNIIESATGIDRAALRTLRRKLSKPDSDSDGDR